MRLSIVISAVMVMLGAPAYAAEPLNGYFIALDTCDAYVSKNRQTNPGDVRVEPRRAYDMLAINKVGGDFFLVRVPNAPETNARWVSTACGLHVIEAGTTVEMPPADAAMVPVPQAREESTDNLLALTWQPAFCESRPRKAECRALNAGNLPDAGMRLSIHGLWPQPNGTFFCGVPPMLVRLDNDREWRALPAPDVDEQTRAALDAAMPGALSQLDRHEWIKHGTCYGGDGGADEYFDDTLLLTDAINGSAVGAFLADRVGERIETADLRAAFDVAFGQGAGDRVQVKCSSDDGRVMITEVRIALMGRIEPETPLASLLAAAEPQTPGCPRGVLDAAGLQ